MVGLSQQPVLATEEGQTATSAPDASEATAPGEDTLYQDIQDRGVLRVGTNSTYAPFEFSILKDGENKVVGVDIFLAEKIADDLGVDLEVVDMEFSNLLTSLDTGQIDIVLAGMTASEERAKSVDFSDIYQVSGQSFVIQEDMAGQITDDTYFDEGGKISVGEGTTQQLLVNDHYPNSEIQVMRTTTDSISALNSGLVDGVLLDEDVAGAYAAENPNLTVIEADLPIQDPGKAAAMPKNQPTLLASVNASIAEAQEQGLIDQWLEDSYQLIEDNRQSTWLAYAPYFINGVKTTLVISATAIFFGLILGTALALMRLSGNKLIDLIAQAYIEIVRGTPLMIQVLFIYLGFAGMFGWSTMTSGLVAVSLNSGAYIAEIIRGGINSVDKGQAEAARSLGLGYWVTMRKVIFPQSLRSIWPSLGNEFVSLIKESSIVSTIGVAELTFQTRNVSTITFNGIIPLIISMAMYFILTFTLTKLLNVYERRMNQKYAQ
jgi:polar amino acid transport system substrate-binding protein